MCHLVSIIMPTYNAEKTVVESINSIRAQTYQNWELLVTDDCSTDDTMNILRSFSEIDTRIKIYSNPKNLGAAAARNNSISHSNGEFIAFLDSDDIWLPEKLEKQISWMIKNPQANFSFTAYELIDVNGKKLNKLIDLQGDNVHFSYRDMLLKRATLGCSTVMLKKTSFDDIAMPLIRTGQDYALWLKLLKQGERAYLINEVLMQYKIMPNSISRNKIKKAMRQWQIYRDIESLSFLLSVKYFISYAWRAVFRK